MIAFHFSGSDLVEDDASLFRKAAPMHKSRFEMVTTTHQKRSKKQPVRTKLEKQATSSKARAIVEKVGISLQDSFVLSSCSPTFDDLART